MRELIDAVRQARQQGKDCVHCCVVETRGSTPQKAGSVMLVFPDGSQMGTLGGGCVEAEVKQKALRLMGQTKPQLLSFTLDDDYGWDDGLICGGRMVFCAQPVTADLKTDYFDHFAELIDAGRGCTEAVIVDAERAGVPAGARFLFNQDGELIASLWADHCPAAVEEGVVDLSSRPRPKSQNGVAFLPVLARCRLVIVGAGHVGQSVAELAHQVGFDVWVIDDRDKYANSERFPNAQQIIVGDIGRTLKEFRADANTYCLIVTRGHSHDEEALFHLAEQPARYVGMIGSKRKIRMIFSDLEKQGISTEALDRVYAPLGLDIGSQTVPEIAVSIVAQLVGHRNRGPEEFPPPRQTAAASCSP